MAHIITAYYNKLSYLSSFNLLAQIIDQIFAECDPCYLLLRERKLHFETLTATSG